MKKLALPLLFLLTATPVGASEDGEWIASRKTDQITGESTCLLSCMACGESSSTENNASVSMTKLKSESYPTLLSFGFKGSNIKLYPMGYFQVDGYEPVKSDNNSRGKNVVIHNYLVNVDPLIEQMKAGLRLKVTNGDELFEMSLIGFTKALKEYLQCQ
ncbi:MAG: hypothetical protein OEY09_14935 [Gammaproteobacteria bacterium]|nr:hypothetical protein [Gammaproteobacteria bacterium]